MRSTPVPADLVACWQTTLVNWTQKASHDALLGLAAKHQELAWLATRYREDARSNPRDWIARDRMKSVQRATAMLAFSVPAAQASAPKKSRGPLALLFVAVLSMFVGLWITDFMRTQQRSTLVSRHP
jgi:hypothetical protein